MPKRMFDCSVLTSYNADGSQHHGPRTYAINKRLQNNVLIRIILIIISNRDTRTAYFYAVSLVGRFTLGDTLLLFL